jgi:hypothetical protein
MYKVVLVLSVVTWAIVIAVLVSSPSDVRRTFQLLRGTRGKATHPLSSFPRSSMAGANLDLSTRRAIRPITRVCDPQRGMLEHWLTDATPVQSEQRYIELLSAITGESAGRSRRGQEARDMSHTHINGT